jgi:hypothetical protein
MARTLVIAIIEARSGKKVEYESDEAKKHVHGYAHPFQVVSQFSNRLRSVEDFWV